MPTQKFMPNDDAGKVKLMEHLVSHLPGYATIFEIGSTDMDALKADAVNFNLALTMHHQAQSYAHNWTAYKNLLRDGGTGNTDWPTLPKADENLSPVALPGIIPRLSVLVAGIKAHKNYTEAIGQDLWLIGAHITSEPGSWKPVLSSRNNAGHPVICWTKGQAAAIEFWADRNDGNGFAFFTINTEPDTVDTTPLPDKGAGVNWRYKAIYRLHDEQVGQWSDVMSIAVGG
ncbi:MAG: hypothetical protein PHP85_03705 [Gallionella sp.]|nr:hypothetical protein [Gallionella sp.]